MIRLATLADVDALVTMGERFIASTPYQAHLRSNPVALRATAQKLIESPTGEIFVYTVGDAPAGMMGVGTFEHPMSGEQTAGELCWWVEPTHRATLGRVAFRLIDRFEAWAQEHQAAVVQLVAPTPEVGALYSRLNYVPIETTWQRRVA